MADDLKEFRANPVGVLQGLFDAAHVAIREAFIKNLEVRWSLFVCFPRATVVFELAAVVASGPCMHACMHAFIATIRERDHGRNNAANMCSV